MTSSPGTCSPGRASGYSVAATDPSPRAQAPLVASRCILRAWLCCLALAFSAPAPCAEPMAEVEQTAVVELRHRSTDEVLPVLGPHIAGRGISLSASDGRIFLRGETRALGALIDLIGAIDVPTRQLWVAVILDDGPPAADIGTAPMERRFATGSRPRALAATDATAASARWRTGGGEGQRVRVQEGQWATIAFRELPSAAPIGARVWAAPGVEVFIDLTRPGPQQAGALRVRPRLIGDQVILEVAVLATADAPRSLEPLVQTLSTTVTGRPGEWMALSEPAYERLQEAQAQVIAQTRRSRPPRVLVRVDPAD